MMPACLRAQMESLQFDNEEMRHETGVLRSQVKVMVVGVVPHVFVVVFVVVVVVVVGRASCKHLYTNFSSPQAYSSQQSVRATSLEPLLKTEIMC